MNILITGANSFIGTYFKNNSPQYHISDVDLLTNKPSEIDFIGTDVVFHVAAIVHQDKSIPEKKYFEVNSDLAFAIAQKAKQDGVRQFVFMSTVKVYGENSSEQNPWSEDSLCFPSDAYGKSKLQAEERIQTLADANFIVTIIRTPVVYGAKVKGNIQKIAQLVKKYPIIPLNGIENKRAMVYIGNLIALIHAAIDQQKGGILLAGDGHLLSTSEFVRYLIMASHQKRFFIRFPKLLQYLIKFIKPGFYNRLFGSMVINNSQTVQQLGFKPPFTPSQGLTEVMASI